MKTTRRFAIAAAAATLLTAAPARGASFTIDLGNPQVGVAHTTPPSYLPAWWGGNDVFREQPGYVGAQVTFTGVPGQQYFFNFEFVWFEAGWESELITAGGNIANKTNGVGTAPGTHVGFKMTGTGSPEIVPFSFLVSPKPADLLSDPTVANGSNPGIGLGKPNIFFSIANEAETGGTTALSGSVMWLALDDSGAGEDVDHDDWVGLLRVTPVPEPSSVILVGGALATAVGRLRRRLGTRTASGRRELEGRQTRA